MRIHKGFYYFLLILIIVINACKKKDDNGADVDQKLQLVGQWEWVYSIGGIAGQVINPDSVGYESHIEFTSNGIYINFIDDTIFRTDTYTIKKFEDPCFFAFIIEYGDSPNYNDQFCAFYGDTMLRLQDNCLDCYDNYYLRK